MAQMNTNRSRPAAARKDLTSALDANLFKALGDPTRLHLLACLAGCCRACSVGEVAACTDVDLSVVSRHLAQLAKAGVITGKRDGKSVRYTIAYGPLSDALRRLSEAVSACNPANRPAAHACRCGCLCCKGPSAAPPSPDKGGCC